MMSHRCTITSPHLLRRVNFMKVPDYIDAIGRQVQVAAPATEICFIKIDVPSLSGSPPRLFQDPAICPNLG